MDYTIVNGELYHHGIKGQRWGVRRFQNKNGSLTAKGRKRYGVGKGDSKNKPKDTKVAAETKKAVTSVHEDYARAHSKTPVSSLSDKELTSINNRLQAEETYKRLNPPKKSLGRKFLDDFIMPAAKDIAKDYVRKYMKEGASYLEKSLNNKAASGNSDKSSEDKTSTKDNSGSADKKNKKRKKSKKSNSSTPSFGDTVDVFRDMTSKMSNYAPQASLGEAFIAGLLEPPKS